MVCVTIIILSMKYCLNLFRPHTHPRSSQSPQIHYNIMKWDYIYPRLARDMNINGFCKEF